MNCPAFGLIVIGDEILSGKRVDKHLPHFVELLAERGLCVGQQRTQHQRRQFLGAETAIAEPGFARGAHPAFEMGDAFAGVADQPVTRRLANQHRTFGNADHRWRQHLSVRIWE